MLQQLSEDGVRLPHIHLVGVADGLADALTASFAHEAGRRVMAWRLQCGTVLCVDSESALNQALQHWLGLGHTVHVWHTTADLDLPGLRRRLGVDGLSAAANLYWTRIAPLARIAPGLRAPKALVDLLDRPDEPDVRLWMASDGAHLPTWALAPPLQALGRTALQSWAEEHLAPRIRSWNDDWLGTLPWPRVPATDAEGLVQESPPIRPLVWACARWLNEDEQQPFRPPANPSNDDRFRLQAARLRAATARTYVAWLHPMAGQPDAERWGYESLSPVASVQERSSDQTGSEACSALHFQLPQVRLSQPPDDGVNYDVWVCLPAALREDSVEASATWCLWLYPEEGFPLLMLAEFAAGAIDAKAAWPANCTPQPGPVRWDDIVRGGISLEQL